MSKLELPEGEKFDLELGDGHYAAFYVREEDGPRIGLILRHKKADGSWCGGSVRWAKSKFENEHPERLSEREKNAPMWKLTGEPGPTMTLSPSVLCLTCGDHGFIRHGKWERA